MAIVAAQIKAAFPEFDLDATSADSGAAQNALITLKIAEAELQVDRTIFKDAATADLAVKYKTAQLLASTPFGITAKLASKDGTTVYDSHFMNVARAASFGFRVP